MDNIQIKPIVKEARREIEKAVYPGNMGFVEIYQLVKTAPHTLADRFIRSVNAGRMKDAIKLLEDYHHIKFDPSIYGKQLMPSKKDPSKRRWQAAFNFVKAVNSAQIRIVRDLKEKPTKVKNMKHVIIQKASIADYYRVKDGKSQLVKGHIRHVVTVPDSEELRKSKFGVFRMRKQELGGEEEKRAHAERERTGEWTPSQERMRERAKQRREDYGDVEKAGGKCPHCGRMGILLRKYKQDPYWIREYKCPKGHVFQEQN